MKRYDTLFTRLVACTAEPEGNQACWVWVRQRNKGGYGRTNLYVPGLGRSVKLYAHVLMGVILASGARTGDDAYLAYVEFKASGLEFDHLCFNTSCINPDHLNPVTPKQNCAARGGWQWR